MKNVIFVYPTNRADLLDEVKNRISPDNALYGLNHLDKFGYKATFTDVSTKLENLLDLLFTPFHKLFTFHIDIDFKLPRAILLLKLINKADVIVTNTDGIGLAVCLLKKLHLIRVPIIYVVGLFYIQGKMKEDIDDKKNTLFMRFYKWVLSGADHIVYHSPVEKQKLSELGFYNPATCSFVAMGSDNKFFKQTKCKVSDFILSVGKDRTRDYETLFKAAKKLPNLKFIVVCREKNIKGLEIPENVNLYFEIAYWSVRDLYEKCSIVVIPLMEMYRSSGQMTLTDSLQTGRPIIVTDVVGISHYPLVDSVNVLKVQPQKPDKLVEAILKLLNNNNLKSTISKNSQFLARRYTTKNYAKGIADVVGWVLDSIKIKPLTKSEIEYVRKIRNNNRQFFLNSRRITKLDQKKWYLEYQKRSNDYMFILTNNGKNLGVGSIYEIDQKHKTAKIGRLIIEKQYQGQGFGRILVEKIEYVARNELQLGTLFLEVLAKNKTALSIYTKSGFKKRAINSKKGLIFMSKNLLRQSNIVKSQNYA